MWCELCWAFSLVTFVLFCVCCCLRVYILKDWILSTWFGLESLCCVLICCCRCDLMCMSTWCCPLFLGWVTRCSLLWTLKPVTKGYHRRPPSLWKLHSSFPCAKNSFPSSKKFLFYIICGDTAFSNIELFDNISLYKVKYCLDERKMRETFSFWCTCVQCAPFELCFVWLMTQMGRELFEKKEAELNKLLDTVDVYIRWVLLDVIQTTTKNAQFFVCLFKNVWVLNCVCRIDDFWKKQGKKLGDFLSFYMLTYYMLTRLEIVDTYTHTEKRIFFLYY